jgi:hypothetical protein
MSTPTNKALGLGGRPASTRALRRYDRGRDLEAVVEARRHRFNARMAAPASDAEEDRPDD